MKLPSWQKRAPEEAHHFNPAFCGALIYEFVRSYTKAKSRAPEFALIFCALPIALHPSTRSRLPNSTITELFTWLESNPDVKIGYAERARNLTPYVREAFQYALARQALTFEPDGLVALGDRRASFTDRFLQDATMDMRDTVSATRKVARWFAGAGDTSTILAAWGVRV